jgi:hypothetical protein
MSNRCRQPGDHCFRRALKLPRGDPQDPISSGRQPLVPEPVAFEGVPARVVGEAVELNHEPVLRPEEVHLEPFEPGVDAWLWELGCLNQVKQLALVVRACERRAMAPLDERT